MRYFAKAAAGVATGVNLLSSTVRTQWADLPNMSYAEILVTENRIENLKAKNACFQVSQIKGNTGRTTNFTSDLSNLRQSHSDEMWLSKVKLCGSEIAVDGIQGFISDGSTEVPLTPIGNLGLNNCNEWFLEEGSQITKILISYDTEQINYIKFTTNGLMNFEKGRPQAQDFESINEFD